jgi:putative transferase (TIGR04331 family)
MFLVTTADERYWKADTNILFLGEWCRLPRRRDSWSRLRSEVLPYHWDDRLRFQADYNYVRGVSKHCLSELVPVLNELHQLDASYRHWNIFLGEWLLDFVGICYDRYLSIRTAAESGKVEMVFLPPLNHRLHASKHMAGYHLHYLSPLFNGYLYSYLVRNLTAFPFEELPLVEDDVMDIASKKKRRFSKTLVANLWRLVLRLTPASSKQITLVNSYFRGGDLLRLSMRLRQFPVLDCTGSTANGPGSYDEACRATLRIPTGETEFERLLSKMLPYQLPSTAVEDCASLRARVETVFPKSSKVIFIANLNGSSDILKMWAAGRIESGARLLLHQHGGNYGTALFSAAEDNQTEIADKYYSWGWTKAGTENVRPWSSAKLIGTRRRFKSRKAGGILVNCDAAPLQFYRFASMPIAHQMSRIHEDYVRFFKSLSAPAFSKALLRLYPVDFGWGEASYYRGALPGLRVYQGPRNFYRQLNRSRLFVCGVNQTSYLETLAAGFPTIIFLNPKYWEIREEARHYFEALKRVGICHASPESAAAFVNRIASDPDAWWRSSDVQEARGRFSNRFARVDGNWIKLWYDELMSSLRYPPVSDAADTPRSDAVVTKETLPS